MKRPLDLDALERRLPAMKTKLGDQLSVRERLGLLFRIALIAEALSGRQS